MSRARRILSGLVVLLLFLPASASIPTAEWNLHLIKRLRSMNRTSPDADLDVAYRTLLPFLPVHGNVGFQSLDPGDDGRSFFRMQYALAPRQLLRSIDAQFVVEVGPAGAEGSLTRNPLFGLVTTVHDELRLFRRSER